MRVLLNVTSHNQDNSAWLSLGVVFAHGGEAILPPLDPDAPLHGSVMAAWRSVLRRADECLQSGDTIDGIMLAGYVPFCVGIAKQARDFRWNIYTSVMKPTLAEDGVKRVFVPAGVRKIIPCPFGQNSRRRSVDGMFHIAPRPLTDDRRDLIELMGCKIIDSPAFLPVAAAGNAATEERNMRSKAAEIVSAAQRQGAGILFDGPPIESALHLWMMAVSVGCPLFFIRTVPAPPPLFATPVAVEKLLF